jgi:hypothetical protein
MHETQHVQKKMVRCTNKHTARVTLGSVQYLLGTPLIPEGLRRFPLFPNSRAALPTLLTVLHVTLSHLQSYSLTSI